MNEESSLSENELRSKAEKDSMLGVDEIWTYGSLAQSRLSDFSRTVANMTATGSSLEMEYALEETIKKLEESSKRKNRPLLQKVFGNPGKEYSEILLSIDAIAVSLRIRQAHLIKDNKIFDDLELLISECRRALEIYIDVGRKRLTEKSDRIEDGSDNEWRQRFEKRIMTLETMHIVTMQGVTQIAVMKQNNITMLENIEAVLSSTIPLWRNQISIEYGIEKYEEHSLNQKKLASLSEKQIRENEKRIRKQVKQIDVNKPGKRDREKLQELNARLEESLGIIKEIEQKIEKESDEMSNIVLKMEEVEV